MALKFTESDLKRRLTTYSAKGFLYTIKKIQKEFQIKIHLIDEVVSKSYCREGEIFLGTIMDIDYIKVLYHEIQHLEHFEGSNGDAEERIVDW